MTQREGPAGTAMHSPQRRRARRERQDEAEGISRPSPRASLRGESLWRDLGLVLAVGLALRVALWWVMPRGSLVSDEPEYLAAAEWLARGRGFSFYAQWPWLRPPAYLLFLALFLRLFGLNLTPIRLVQVALSLSVPALVYLLGRAMWDRRVALWAGLVAACWLPLAVLPHLALAENLFLPLLLGAFYCLVCWQKHPHPGWLVAGGGLLGLATLTRALTVAFLPLAALWVICQGRATRQVAPTGTPDPHPRRTWWQALIPGALLVGAALIVIVPWTGYTWRAYGRPILVDTTGGYNFWLGTQGGQFHNAHEVQRTLLEIPDPASRQAYAYRKGWEVIAADPGKFLRGRLTEVRQLLRINYGADERLADGFSLGAVSVPHLLALFLLEDTFYIVLVPLALVGMFVGRGEPGRGLALLWLGYNLLVGVAFFAIGRFRLPLLPFLALYAAALVQRPWRSGDTLLPHPPGRKRPGYEGADVNVRAPGLGAPEGGLPLRSRAGNLPARLAAAGLLAVAFWIVAMPSCLGPYPASLGATQVGLRGRAVARHLARAEAAMFSGDLEGAQAALRPALAYLPDGFQPLPSARVVQAQVLRARGDEAGALAALEGSEWYQACLLRGDILRAQGDAEGARGQFELRKVAERNPLDWAWGHLHPPAGRQIDLGGGLDWGLVDGFYRGERSGEVTFRWSGPEARLRFPGAGTGSPLHLRLRLWGWRPVGERPAEVVAFADGVEMGRFTLPAGRWEEVVVPVPAVPAGEDVVVTLRTTTFLPGPPDLLETGQLRMLGVMVDWAELDE